MDKIETPYIIAGVAAVTLLLLRKKLFDAIVDLSMSKYRWISIVLLVLPMSFLFNIFWYLRNRYVQWTKSAPKKHNERVRRVCEDLKTRDPSKPMCTARPSWQGTTIYHGNYKKTFHKVDLNDFVDILEIDTKRAVVRCEPLVTCGQLTSTLAPLGWTTAIIPELDDLTVGGLIAGFGVEGTSFKYGLFQHICESFEVVIADGTLVKCSKDENAELFYNIPWSYGTLGFLVAAEIRLIPLKKYMKIQYEPCYKRQDFLKLMEKYSREKKVDFIETLAYSSDEAVVMTGTMCDRYEVDKYNPIGHSWKPWFYQHVKGFLKNGAGYDYIPCAHYFHRHTKSLFWEMEDILPFGNHPLFRYTLGWLVPPKVSFLKLTTTAKVHEIMVKKHVDQDMLVPYKKLSETLDMFDKEWKVYPLWLCPCLIPKTPVRGLVNPISDDDLYIDVGAYGVAKADNFDPEPSHRRVEKFVRSIGGFQTLYAATYMTREEFYEMFDHKVYNKLREKYKCDGAFPVIYDKISKSARA